MEQPAGCGLGGGETGLEEKAGKRFPLSLCVLVQNVRFGRWGPKYL